MLLRNLKFFGQQRRENKVERAARDAHNQECDKQQAVLGDRHCVLERWRSLTMTPPKHIRSLPANPYADESPDWNRVEPEDFVSGEPGKCCDDNANAATDHRSLHECSNIGFRKVGGRYKLHASAFVRCNVLVDTIAVCKPTCM
jgi:hypothetical protein